MEYGHFYDPVVSMKITQKKIPTTINWHTPIVLLLRNEHSHSTFCIWISMNKSGNPYRFYSIFCYSFPLYFEMKKNKRNRHDICWTRTSTHKNVSFLYLNYMCDNIILSLTYIHTHMLRHKRPAWSDQDRIALFMT